MIRRRFARRTPEEVRLIRRLTMIEMRAALPADLVATIFGVTPALVYQETSRGFPAELDLTLARSTVDGVREVLAWWAKAGGEIPHLGASRKQAGGSAEIDET